MNNLNAPVLFLVFNRLDVTTSVFKQISIAKPSRLYIACDGHRSHKEGEDKIVTQLRQYLLDNINWECEVFTLFREKNLGCALAVSEAISWFFEHEEMGIILEDDCLPSQSFFKFCNELLNKYKDDKRVWHIGGYSLLDDNKLVDSSYYFSNITQIWGWATWRNRWQHYDLYMKKYPLFIKSRCLDSIFSNNKIKVWNKMLLSDNYGETFTWDWQWYFTSLSNHGMTITPKISLIQNLGVGDPNAAHPSDDTFTCGIKSNEINFPLIEPKIMCIDNKLDAIYFNWQTRWLWIKLVKKQFRKFDKRLFDGKVRLWYRQLKSKFMKVI